MATSTDVFGEPVHTCDTCGSRTVKSPTSLGYDPKLGYDVDQPPVRYCRSCGEISEVLPAKKYEDGDYTPPSGSIVGSTRPKAAKIECPSCKKEYPASSNPHYVEPHSRPRINKLTGRETGTSEVVGGVHELTEDQKSGYCPNANCGGLEVKPFVPSEPTEKDLKWEKEAREYEKPKRVIRLARAETTRLTNIREQSAAKESAAAKEAARRKNNPTLGEQFADLKKSLREDTSWYTPIASPEEHKDIDDEPSEKPENEKN